MPGAGGGLGTGPPSSPRGAGHGEGAGAASLGAVGCCEPGGGAVPAAPPLLRWLPQGCGAWPLRGGQGPQEPPTRFLGRCGDGVTVEGLLGLHSQPGAPLLPLWVLLTPPLCPSSLPWGSK